MYSTSFFFFFFAPQEPTTWSDKDEQGCRRFRQLIIFLSLLQFFDREVLTVQLISGSIPYMRSSLFSKRKREPPTEIDSGRG